MKGGSLGLIVYAFSFTWCYGQNDLIFGLDHVVIAVHDLEDAGARYRDLGFTLKPGRQHENGLRNLHAKFPDGTELELITADSAVDALTVEYMQHLSVADGPLFVALYAPSIDGVARRLDAAGILYRKHALLTFGESDGFRYIFFGGRNASPTDRPEHFIHPNEAKSLVSVWLADDNFDREFRLLGELGIDIRQEMVEVPAKTIASIALVREHRIVFLPGSFQIIPGRKIIGVTLETGTLDFIKRKAGEAARIADERHIVLEPHAGGGIWLEFQKKKDH